MNDRIYKKSPNNEGDFLMINMLRIFLIASVLIGLALMPSGVFALSWQAFPGWEGSTNLEQGDLSGNGAIEKVATMGPGGGPHVRIFSSDGRLLGQFDAYDSRFHGGVNLAVGDVNGDGLAEIVTGAGPGGGPHVRVFNAQGKILDEWFEGNIYDRSGVSVDIKDGEIIAWVPNQSQLFEMAVPFHHQEHTLSCEVASLKSALAYHGINVSESELIKYQPISYPLEYKNGTWGDPSKGYVGNIDGSQPRMTGYGIYWEPIAELARRYRPAESFRGKSWQNIQEYLESGRVVIIWGNYHQNPQTLIWKTADGAGVLGFVGEHTYIVSGWEGDPRHPNKIILLDPMRGRLKMDYDDFIKNWSFLDYSGVVI